MDGRICEGRNSFRSKDLASLAANISSSGPITDKLKILLHLILLVHNLADHVDDGSVPVFNYSDNFIRIDQGTRYAGDLVHFDLQVTNIFYVQSCLAQTGFKIFIQRDLHRSPVQLPAHELFHRVLPLCVPFF